MFENFTNRARKVFALANQQAQQFGVDGDYVTPEHVALGLLKEGTGTAIHQSIVDAVTMGKLPLHPRTKIVVKIAEEEAEAMGHHYVGTEHILMGLMRETESAVLKFMVEHNRTVEVVLEDIRRLLARGAEQILSDPTDKVVPFQSDAVRELMRAAKAAFGYMDCDSDAASNLRKAISAIEPPVHFQSDFLWNWTVCKAGHEETKTAIIKYVTCPECLAFIAKIAADYAGRKTP